jgi:hypothetical protein
MMERRIPNNLALERCRCGHLRAHHIDTASGFAKGHGACHVELPAEQTAQQIADSLCPCEKFSWAAEPVGGYTYSDT